MTKKPKITPVERDAALVAAVSAARRVIGYGEGYIASASKLGSLSDMEWDKLVGAIIAGWATCRAEQLTGERLYDDSYFYATGQYPEPTEIGTCAHALKALGDLVERLGLTDQPIGEWSREHVLMFVFNAAELVIEARTARDERPGPSDMLMVG